MNGRNISTVQTDRRYTMSSVWSSQKQGAIVDMKMVFFGLVYSAYSLNQVVSLLLSFHATDLTYCNWLQKQYSS